MSQLVIENVSFSYTKKKQILQDINYTFEKGNMYAIMGKSGAGKTTLLSLLSLLSKPTSGTILYEGKDSKDKDQYAFRSKEIGVIFQSFNLLPKLTAMENVILSMDIANMKNVDKKSRAKELLEKVGLHEEDIHRPILKLSGGQQQRVAIARALSYNPMVLLADEPTGNLDSDTEDDILSIFKSLVKEDGKCIIVVTHSQKVAKSADEIYKL